MISRMEGLPCEERLKRGLVFFGRDRLEGGYDKGLQTAKWQRGSKCGYIIDSLTAQGVVGHEMKLVGRKLKTNERMFFFAWCVIEV